MAAVETVPSRPAAITRPEPAASVPPAAPTSPATVAPYEADGPPLDVANAEEEAIIAENREAESFNFVLPALPVTAVAETGKTSFPGDKDFDEAVSSLPAGLADKLRITLGAEFTALRPIPAGKLRKPS